MKIRDDEDKRLDVIRDNKEVDVDKDVVGSDEFKDAILGNGNKYRYNPDRVDALM